MLYRLPEFCVHACSSCALVYLWPLPSEEKIRETFSQLYTTGEGSVPELADYYGYCFDDSRDNPLVQRYELWLDRVERHREPGRLLDVGCGTGLFLAVARRRGWKVLGLDESEEATQHARKHFGLDVWVGDFAAFHELGERFDVITGWDVIEHARDPIGLMRAMEGCLADEGVVALTTPNQRSMLDLIAGALYRASGGRIYEPLLKFYLEQHFLYFTPDTLRAAFGAAGLRVIHYEQESTDLRRLALNPLMRLALGGLFGVGRMLGLQNRMLMIAGSAQSEHSQPQTS